MTAPLSVPKESPNRVVGFGQVPQESRLGYDAVDTTSSTKKRKARSAIIRSEDRELDDQKRQRLGGTAHDMRRNFALLQWAIRKHFDYVCDHSLQFFTPDDGLNEYLEEWTLAKMEAGEFDEAGRHDLKSFARITEGSAIIGGDCGWHLTFGGRVQGIEFDRVRSDRGKLPEARDGQRWVNGVRVNKAGRALGYAVHQRTDGGDYLFEREVDARWMLWHGCFERIDQVRGVSPIAAAIASYQDVYENVDYALMKSKVSQILIAAIYRMTEDTGGEIRQDSDTEEAEDDGSKPRYDVSFSKPTLLDLEPGERAEILSSNTPADEFQQFMRFAIAIALISLDIPYSFFDASIATFFGNKADKDAYILSTKEKKRYLRETRLYPWLKWRLLVGYLTGDLDLGPYDFSIFDRQPYEWIPAGVPWWDPAKDIDADLKLLGAGLTTRDEIRRTRWGDGWLRNVPKQLRKEQDVLESERIWITQAGPAPAPAGAASVAETDEADDEREGRTQRSGGQR